MTDLATSDWPAGTFTARFEAPGENLYALAVVAQRGLAISFYAIALRADSESAAKERARGHADRTFPIDDGWTLVGVTATLVLFDASVSALDSAL